VLCACGSDTGVSWGHVMSMIISAYAASVRRPVAAAQRNWFSGRRALAAIICLLATMSAPPTFAQQPCPTLVVSNNNDVVNGNTSSPCALVANPGPDGISLREAILAANNATGGGGITINFASTLAGQTITLNSSNGLADGLALDITRNQISVAGFTQSGQPAVTIDANNMFVVFNVLASDFSLSSLTIAGIPSGSFGVQIWTGAGWTPPAPQNVQNISIQGNVFSNTKGAGGGNPISLGTNATSASNATLSQVTIAGNTFSGFPLDALRVTEWGNGNTVEEVRIVGNIFAGTMTPIELVPANGAANNQLLRTRIVGNTFSNNLQPIVIDPSGEDGQPSPTTNNVIDSTIFARNVFTNNSGPAISLLGGIGIGSTVTVTHNTIINTVISDNLVTDNTEYGAVSIVGGRENSSQNSVSGVSIVNNTFANYSGVSGNGGVIDVENDLGGTNNSVSGVTVRNTILWNNTPSDFTGANAVPPSQVTTSITAQAGYAGINGNIAANPRFVDPSDNFELQSSSPALHAGSSAGAPAIDIDCQARGAPPSIGAYEYEGPDICPATYSAPLPLNATPASGHGPLAVTFHSSGLTRTKSYIINFGDGTTGPVTQGSCLGLAPIGGGQNGIQCAGSASHTYTAAGTYTATLVNVSGGSLGSSATITVGGARPLAPGGGWWRMVPAR
jgi:hypothetical protein